MVYFDNAATGGYKVHAAVSAAESVMKFLSANPGRSGHRLSTTGAKIVAECRTVLADTFNADASRVIFTKNCTEALNTAIFGLNLQKRVITTEYEHNSVLRPLFHLARKGAITLEVIPVDDILTTLNERIDENVSAIVTTAVSNVTGKELPVGEIGRLAKERNIKYIVDGAQGAGHIPLSVRGENISCLALAGHKGLGGIMGSGALILGDDVEIAPLTFGGTGTESFAEDMPEFYPERLEAGTLNLPAIASLLEGVRHVARNFTHFARTLETHTERLITGLSAIDKVRLYSKLNPAGIVSFRINGIGSQEVATVLNDEFDVAVRGGFHCAPLTHKALGTEKEGLVRASLSVYNSASEIDYFIRAIRKIAAKF